VSAAGARERLAVVGTGTMGVGIVQLGALAGFDVIGHDRDAAARERAGDRLREALEKGAARGRWSSAEGEAALARVRFSGELADLADRTFVIEAAPERLELKRELLARLEEIVGDGAVLASNTSSLSISGIALELARPERVAGLHFFNPPALMRLVEVVAGDRTSADTLERSLAVVRAMGREPINTADTIGFVVNRCARPFVGEALRLLAEGVASAEAIDRVCREAGGFRMGPHELVDLIGVDVNLEIQESFWRQGYGEPRWRPMPLQAGLVQAGRLGRKAGRGFFDYPREAAGEPAPPPGASPPRSVAVVGAGRLADELAAAVARTDMELVPESDGVSPDLVVDARPTAEPVAARSRPMLVCCAASTLAGRGASGAAGFDLAAPLENVRTIELARDAHTLTAAVDAAEGLASALGKGVEWVLDAPGLVLGRIVAQLANEAAFALQEGVASARDIDLGMRLGMNFPRGPLAWADERGVERCVATLDALRAYTGEERYRVAPLLRRLAGGSDMAALAGRGARAPAV
jgi:3-hydroxybutyryl-CoA dehydrogenase